MKRLLAIALLLFGVSGCATLGLPGAYKPADIDRLLAEKRFDAALKAANEPGATAAQQTQVKRAAGAYERQVLAAAATANGRGEHGVAMALLDEGLDHYTSDTLQSAYNQAKAKRAQVLARLAAEQLLETYWYQQKLVLNGRQTDRAGREEADTSYTTRSRERTVEAMRPRLLEASRAMFDDREFELARALAAAGREISDDDDARTLQARIEKSLKPSPSAKPAARAEPAKVPEPDPEELAARAAAHFERVIEEARKLIREGKIQQAREALDTLDETYQSHPQTTILRTRVDTAISMQISELLENANQLYRNGKIEEARKQWLLVLDLSPDHVEAGKNLKRAERVLQNIKQIERSAQ